MTVCVVVPWRPGCPHRRAAWDWVRARYATTHPDWQIVTADCPDGPFSRSRGIIAGAAKADGDILVAADADVWCDGIDNAIDHLDTTGWAVPHRLIHRLAPESTEKVLAGGDWRRLPLSHDNAQDLRPYVGHETGTLVVLRRDVLNDAPPDRRFVGWGQEDAAWSHALRLIVGPPWRGTADLVHLWHPPQPRANRRVGSSESLALLNRYRRARTADQARALIAESRPA